MRYSPHAFAKEKRIRSVGLPLKKLALNRKNRTYALYLLSHSNIRQFYTIQTLKIRIIDSCPSPARFPVEIVFIMWTSKYIMESTAFTRCCIKGTLVQYFMNRHVCIHMRWYSERWWASTCSPFYRCEASTANKQSIHLCSQWETLHSLTSHIHRIRGIIRP